MSMFDGVRYGPLAHVGRTKVGGFIVSTVLSPDEGHETAIIDAEHAIPVERYENEEDARAGHQRWVEKMKDPPKTVTRLGWLGSLVDPEDFELTPMEDNG